MSGIEQAAAAFETAIGNGEAAPVRTNNSESRPTEQMFGNIGALEVDEDSPIEGGGDHIDDPKPRRPRREPVAEDDQGAEDDELDPDADPDADPDEEGDEEGDDAKKDDEEDEEFYEVVVDGVKKEVGLREALDGYIRQETFHQRLNELNDVKQAIRVEAQELISDRRKYTAKIEELDKHIEMLVPKEPDWDEEYKRDPVAARALQKRYEEFNATRTLLRQERERVSKEQAEKDEQETKEFIRTENAKILKNNPSWAKPEVMTRDVNMMADAARKAGFSDEEIKSVHDSRMVTILLKAAKWDKLQGDRPKPVRRGARPVKQGAGSGRTAPKVNTAMKQLSRTGSVEDAANVFSGIINPRRR